MTLHTLLVVAVVLMSLWAIVSPRIPTCVLGTLGLLCVAVAALLTLDDYTQPVVDLLLLGILLGGLQIVWRAYMARGNRHMRRMSDWAPEWMHTDPPREVDVTNQQHIGGGRK